MSGKLNPKSTQELDRKIGLNIKKNKKAMGFMQADLALLLGVTYQQIQKYERGENRISAVRLYELSVVLEVNMEDLWVEEQLCNNYLGKSNSFINYNGSQK